MGYNLEWGKHLLMRAGPLFVVIRVIKATTGFQKSRARSSRINHNQEPNDWSLLHALNRKLWSGAPLRSPRGSLVESFIRFLRGSVKNLGSKTALKAVFSRQGVLDAHVPSSS